MIFGFVSLEDLRAVFEGDLGCFYQLGSHQLCHATQRLSINVSLLLLSSQALISRILVPGMSNFVNASVRLFAT